ncbi:hypothetical protein GCM10025751_20730 [Haladaptatus pallidirubidus]|uniref:Tat (Twin-arginine translocation) pathway signal sequence n=2 Tax=Haladaptatus pallidirubidus TaxID=1008152 RepID=A0AAV3UGY2_9EURY
MHSHRTSRRNLLKASAGVAVVSLAIPTLSSTAIAHFPNELDIDVKPDDDSNEINLGSRGVVPVVVHQTDEFDPTSEAVRYRFGSPATVADGGGACPIHEGHAKDFDGDGSDELLFHFRIKDAGFEEGATEAELRWEKDDSGEHGLSGRDSVTIVGGDREHDGDGDSMNTGESGHQHEDGRKDENEC